MTRLERASALPLLFILDLAGFNALYWGMSQKTLSQTALPAWLPYVAPLALFLVLTTVEGQFTSLYPILYTVKVALVGGLLLALGRRHPPEARPQGHGLGLAMIAGVLLVFAWILVDQHTPHPKLLQKLMGTRVAYNPFQHIADPVARDAFLAVRFLGLVAVVPVIEETFYRGFLLRYVTDLDDFRRVPLGTFSWGALGVNVVLFMLSHPEWLAAAIFALAMCGLLARTKNLFACIVAHAVTNLLLGLYVVHAGAWQYW